MEQVNQVKQLTCPNHKFCQLDSIHLTGKTDQVRICSLCVAKNQIPFEEILSIQELFTKNKEELLNTYPPLKNQQTRELIERYSQENSQNQNIDEFFKYLRLEVEEAIQISENKAKQQLIKHSEGKKILIQEINKIAEVDKLKEHLISGKNENLNEFLKQKWKGAEKNNQTILTIIAKNEIPLFKFNLKEKQKEIQTLISSLQNFTLLEGQNLTFFQEQQLLQEERSLQINNQMLASLNALNSQVLIRNQNSIINKQNLIKSSYSDSQKLTISKTLDGSLQLINSISTGVNGQAFLDFVLNPKLSYTIRLNYQPKGNESSFFFGIVSDQDKDTGWGNWISKMSYFNCGSDFGISKYLKGPNINSGQRKCQKEEFEVRIQLKQKMLQVASFPGYESILTLDDPNKISSSISYRFWVFMCQQGDIIEISEILELYKYEKFKI